MRRRWVLWGIGEDLRVGGGVRPGVPGGVFVLMAALAVGGHGEHVQSRRRMDSGSRAEEMDADVTQLGGEAGVVAVEAAHVVVRRAVDGADLCGHLVAVGAAGAVLRCVVVRRAVHAAERQRATNATASARVSRSAS